MKRQKDNRLQYKKAFIGWLGIYLLITLLIYCLDSIIRSLPVYIQTLILTAISTPLMYIVTPLLNKVLLRKKC
jgi:antibiotic biosynthesis monooxygenase (ABM) superfamily enzyme